MNGKGDSFVTPVIATIASYCDNEEEGLEILRLLVKKGADPNQYYKAPAFAPYTYHYVKDNERSNFESALGFLRVDLGVKK